ncbi:MAG: isopentenyl phosphate kinase [Thermoanaerobaculia bacterium]
MPNSNDHSREVILLKLGGSLITDKTRPDALRPQILERLAQEIAGLRRDQKLDLVIGHGSGSFGHATAARYNVSEGLRKPEQRFGVAATRAAAARLNQLVVEGLLAAGESPFPIAPSSVMVARFGLARRFFLETLLAALEQELLPVVFGDVVMDSGQGAAIASTETVFSALAQQLPRRRWVVRRMVWLGETAGIYDREGRTIPTLSTTSIPRLLMGLSGASGVDVTGGVRHRVETAARLAKRGITSWILDGREPGLLAQALAGEEVPGTVVLAS